MCPCGCADGACSCMLQDMLCVCVRLTLSLSLNSHMLCAVSCNLHMLIQCYKPPKQPNVLCKASRKAAGRNKCRICPAHEMRHGGWSKWNQPGMEKKEKDPCMHSMRACVLHMPELYANLHTPVFQHNLGHVSKPKPWSPFQQAKLSCCRILRSLPVSSEATLSPCSHLCSIQKP